MNLKNKLLVSSAILVFSLTAIGLSLFIDFQRLNAAFKKDVSDVNRAFIQKMSSIETVLTSLAGLHHASEDLNPAELSSFSSEMLKAYPYIDSIMTMEKLGDNQLTSYESRMQEQGYVNLKLKNINESSAGSYGHYHLPVDFIEPMTPRSASMLGVDIYSLPGMHRVIDFAVSSGKVAATQITESINLKKPSLLMFKALYLGRYPPETSMERMSMLDGLVGIEIDVERFMGFLDLKKYAMTGHLSNLDLQWFAENNQKIMTFKVSADYFTFMEKFRMYNQNYQLEIKRKLSFDMFNKKQMLAFWLFFMFLLAFILIFIKRRRMSKDEIEYLAYYDSLTRLPNRSSFKKKLDQAIDYAMENNTMGAVLFMDVDEFKRINDTLGHDVGDELLKQMSRRMMQHMRKRESTHSDGMLNPGDVVARLGGDEFTLLLTDIKSADAAGLVANRILQTVSRPFHLHDHEVYVTSSIGIAVFPADGNDVELLLKHADTAMYHAKDVGKNNYQFYQKKMSMQNEKRLKLEEKLHQALKNKEFVLYYQPQIDAKTNKIIAAEALLRWQQRELGMIFPDDFIPLAEETGQIIEIGEWVINEACRQNKQWQDAGYTPIRVAINLSCLQFMQDDLSVKIQSILKKTGLPPACLELEITESIMMRNVDKTISTIQHFSDMNIDVSIDDFGTGYSSLSYLKKFSLKSLKIDKSFVLDIPQDKDDMMITAAIISMAKSLNLKVIAEGVETERQIDFLKARDCDVMQGYYFSKPVPASEFEKMLEKSV